MRPERLRTLVDNVYGFSMTLLAAGSALSLLAQVDFEGTDVRALAVPVVVSAFAFIVVSNWWRSHSIQMDLLSRLDPATLALHLGVLFLVTLTPVTTALWAMNFDSLVAMSLLLGNLALLLVMLLASWLSGRRRGLFRPTQRRMVRAFAFLSALLLVTPLVLVALGPLSSLVFGTLIALWYYLPLPGSRWLWGEEHMAAWDEDAR